MDTLPHLQPGSQLHCPHCHRWHPVIAVHTTGTAYTVAMRYWECRGNRYYAGQEGGTSRNPVRNLTRQYAVSGPSIGFGHRLVNKQETI
jgi:hypothetical protein